MTYFNLGAAASAGAPSAPAEKNGFVIEAARFSPNSREIDFFFGEPREKILFYQAVSVGGVPIDPALFVSVEPIGNDDGLFTGIKVLLKTRVVGSELSVFALTKKGGI